MFERSAGIFLPIFSLPSKYGVGDFGEFSYKFIDLISKYGFKYWQILPLNPVDISNQNSPYMSSSLFAGNFLFISIEFLIKEKLLDEKDIGNLEEFKEDEVEYEKVYEFKERILNISYENFLKKEDEEFLNFCDENSFWLESFSIFNVLKKYFKKGWNKWPLKIIKRDEKVIKDLKKIFEREINKEKFIQYIFYKEYKKLKNYANEKGIKIIGDFPIYPSFDSSDVWENQEIFKIDENFYPLYVAGVPPDYFSEKGQLWGNPVYNWEKLKEKEFDYFIKRFKQSLKFYDLIRIDHFRGFVAYYEIPYGKEDAREGKWVPCFPYDFFEKIFNEFKNINIIAEDLGYITEDVIEVREKFKIPGMRVFIFGFGDKNKHNPHLPHNYIENSISYTTTHDTNTLKGWFLKEIDEDVKEFFLDYINKKGDVEEILLEVIRILIFSKSNLVIFPIQDILFLDENARINRPGKKEGNWKWKLSFKKFNEIEERLKIIKKFIEIYGR